MDNKFKDFSKEINIILEVENLRSQNISIKDMPGNASINKLKKEFQLSFNGIFKYPDNGKLEINIDEQEYEIGSSDFRYPMTWHTKFDNIEWNHTFDIDSIQRGDLKKSTSFRMFFFDTSNRNFLFHHKLESPKYDEEIPWASNCVRIILDGNRYDIVQHKTPDASYIVIENHDAISYKDFKKDSYAIQKGIGYLIGYMPGGEHYIFSGSNFEYQRLARMSLKSIYYPVTKDLHSFVDLHDDKETINFYKEKLSVIPLSVISKFVQQIKDNEDFSVTILYLMEVLHLKSLVSMPGAFTVVLESLANIIINSSRIKTKLISDNELDDEIIEELYLVIDKYSSQLDNESIIKLKRKLNAVNSPINPRRITNAMKLREPFDQLGIKLSLNDEYAIEYRNYLLHGNILMNDGNVRSSNEIDDHMMYISAKLYTLISKLLLKYCGFSGYVINHAKFHASEKSPKENYYFEEI